MQPSVPGKPYWWQWATIASVDAPVVALAWQGLVSRVTGTQLAWPHRLILGASIWLAYAADRWIEGWNIAPAQIRTQRLYFYQRHRWPLAILWLAVFAADLTAAFLRLRQEEFRTGFLVLLPVLAYILSHQFAHRHHPWRVPKEICVALLLTAGVGLFPATQISAPQLSPLTISLGFFGLLCFANCALISTWEHEVDRIHGQTSLAVRYARATRLSRSYPWIIAALASALGFFQTGPIRTVAICAAVSGLLLAGVDWLERRTHWQLARVLADAALLTPLAALIWGPSQ